MDPFLGEILYVAFNFPPRGFHNCDGTLLPIASNTALFALLGTTYGGDGIHNFALPKLPPPLDHGGLYVIALQGVFPSRD